MSSRANRTATVTPIKMTAEDIHRSLREHRHPRDQWIYVREARTRTGFVDNASWSSIDQVRSIDAFAMGAWKSTGYRRVAYEIKVSRGDFLREIKDPYKHLQAYFLAHEFWFAVAPNVVLTDGGGDLLVYREALDGCGVLEVAPDGQITVLQRAHRHEAWPLPEAFIASLLRQAFAISEQVRAEPPPPPPAFTATPLFEEVCS